MVLYWEVVQAAIQTAVAAVVVQAAAVQAAVVQVVVVQAAVVQAVVVKVKGGRHLMNPKCLCLLKKNGILLPLEFVKVILECVKVV